MQLSFYFELIPDGARSGIADQFWLGDMDRPSEAPPP